MKTTEITSDRNECTDVLTMTVTVDGAPHINSSKDFSQGLFESQSKQLARGRRWAEAELQRLYAKAYQEMAT